MSVNQTFTLSAKFLKSAAMKPLIPSQPSRFRLISHYIGRSFYSLRKQARLSQARVAELAGVSRSTVSDFESGKRHSVSTPLVEAMAHAIGSTLMMLVSLADRLSQQEA